VITFEVPSSQAIGPAILKVQNGAGETSLPIAINIDAPPPVIQSALAGVSAVLDDNHYVRPNDLMTLVVGNLFEGATQVGGSVKISVGGVEHSPIAILNSAGGATQIQIILANGVPQGDDIPVTVGVETRVSDAFPINIKAN
jgi:hypothetical protein